VRQHNQQAIPLGVSQHKRGVLQQGNELVWGISPHFNPILKFLGTTGDPTSA
jgi:hypothetical protein